MLPARNSPPWNSGRERNRSARGAVFGPEVNPTMTHESNRVSGAAQRALSVRCLRSLVLFLSLPVAAAAQTRMAVSTTDDVAPAVGVPFTVTDGDLVTVADGLPVSPYFAGGHFQAACGFIPTDVDAFAYLPGSRPGSAGALVFSLLSNQDGFLDGDVVKVVEGGGAALLVSELELAGVLGVPGANLDLDALAYDDQGLLLFSLADDLTGTTLGTVQDGDVLQVELGFSGVTRVLTETEVQSRFTFATGMSDSILDVLSLEWANGALWASVQSPTRHDGSVLALNGVAQVVYDENALGLGGAEIDALGELRAGDEIPAFHLSKEIALPGDTLHVEMRGRPNGVQIVFMAGASGFLGLPRVQGFGGLYVDRFDPWLVALRSTRSLPFVALDAAGRFAIDWSLPAGLEFGIGPVGELGWSFQTIELFPLRVSAPFRVQKL